MPAEISKGLISKIKRMLGNNLVKRLDLQSDGLLYEYLTDDQEDLMVNHLTTIVEYPITLVSGTEEYDLNPRIHKIIKAYFDDADSECLCSILPGNKLKVTGFESNTDNTLKLECYIKPAWTTEEVNKTPVTTYDEISETLDPIIGREYHRHLVDAVLSRFREYNKSFRSMEEVERDVKRTAINLRGANKVKSEFSNKLKF